jgi:iron complex outermembrane recepter protein
LRSNIAAFKYDYRNLQVTLIGSGSSVTLNAAAAKIKGIDGDFEFRPVRHLTISGNARLGRARGARSSMGSEPPGRPVPPS